MPQIPHVGQKVGTDMSKATSMCNECGVEMFTVKNPSPNMLRAHIGFVTFQRQLETLAPDFEPYDAHLAFCANCDSTAIIGPQITMDVTIMEDPKI